MKIEKTAIYLEEQDIIELQAIVLDEDAAEALEFAKRLKKKIEVQQRALCGTPLASSAE